MEEKLATLEKMKWRFYKNVDNPDDAKNYAEAIHDCLYEDLIELDEAKQEFEFILEQFPRLYRIRNFIAETLAPWEHQNIDEIIEALESLADYYHRNPEQEEIAESYAISLWLYYVHPEARNRSTVLNTLAELINDFPENETINEKYYDVLSLQDDRPSIDPDNSKKGIVSISHPKKISTEDEAKEYAYSLLYFANQQNNLPEIYRTYEKLESLSIRFPQSEYINECCAKTLYNALPYMDDSVIPELLEDLRAIQARSSSEEVAKVYALSLEDSPKVNIGIVEELSRIYKQFPMNESIIDSYGFILSSLVEDSNAQEDDRAEAFELFCELREDHPEVKSLEDYLSL